MPTDATTRDRIWNAVIEKAYEQNYQFSVTEVMEHADLDESQRITVRRTMHVMADYGWIDQQEPASPYWTDGPKIRL